MTDRQIIREYNELNKRIQNSNSSSTEALIADSERLLEIMTEMKKRKLIRNHSSEDILSSKEINEQLKESLIQGIPALIFGLIVLVPGIMIFNHSGFQFILIFLWGVGGIFTLLGLFHMVLIILALINKAMR